MYSNDQKWSVCFLFECIIEDVLKTLYGWRIVVLEVQTKEFKEAWQ